MKNLELKFICAILIIGCVVWAGGWLESEPNVQGVNIGNEYHASTTRNHAGGENLANLQVLQNHPGALGSVIITGANGAVITLYDATSTVDNSEWGTTTLAQFPTNTATGTYAFDATFTKGLLIEYSGNLATGTITWR